MNETAKILKRYEFTQLFNEPWPFPLYDRTFARRVYTYIPKYLHSGELLDRAWNLKWNGSV